MLFRSSSRSCWVGGSSPRCEKSLRTMLLGGRLRICSWTARPSCPASFTLLYKLLQVSVIDGIVLKCLSEVTADKLTRTWLSSRSLMFPLRADDTSCLCTSSLISMTSCSWLRDLICSAGDKVVGSLRSSTLLSRGRNSLQT